MLDIDDLLASAVAAEKATPRKTTRRNPATFTPLDTTGAEFRHLSQPIYSVRRTGPEEQYVHSGEFKGDLLARSRYSVAFLQKATYRDEHFIGISPLQVNVCPAKENCALVSQGTANNRGAKSCQDDFGKQSTFKQEPTTQLA